MLAYCPLASGSKGNALLVQTPETRILIDCGLRARELQRRLNLLGLSIEDLDGVLITHEHGDHIDGVASLLRLRQLPIMCNRDTACAMEKALNTSIPCHLFTTYEEFRWRDLDCLPFSLCHDALDPVGFRLTWQGHHLGICTDLGCVPPTLIPLLKRSALLYVEANHDVDKVRLSQRPLSYQERVLSRFGHLSNLSCAELLSEIISPHLQHVYLAHLSADCNTPSLALETIRSFFEEVQIPWKAPLACAYQETPSPLIHLHV